LYEGLLNIRIIIKIRNKFVLFLITF